MKSGSYSHTKWISRKGFERGLYAFYDAKHAYLGVPHQQFTQVLSVLPSFAQVPLLSEGLASAGGEADTLRLGKDQHEMLRT